MEAITTTFDPDWETKHRKAIDRLEELRRNRGIALMEGKTFDSRQIMAAEADVDACAAAITETSRRQREKAEQRFRTHVDGQKTKLLDAMERRQHAIKAAEIALQDLTLSLLGYLSTSKEAGILIRDLGGSVGMISEYEVIRRAALRISLAMRAVTGPCARFGGIEFLHVSPDHVMGDGTSPNQSWAEADASKIATDLAKVLQEKSTNDQR